MNSQDYEVIKNIQNAEYGGRQYYSDILTPDFEGIAKSNNWFYRKLDNLSTVETVFDEAIKSDWPALLEIDMLSIGPFARAFGGPPVKNRSKNT